MTYTACMLPKWDRADMKFLDIINGANSKFTFFCDRKAVDESSKKENQSQEIDRKKKLNICKERTKTKKFLVGLAG